MHSTALIQYIKSSEFDVQEADVVDCSALELLDFFLSNTLFQMLRYNPQASPKA
jgi:hypothetical protein